MRTICWLILLAGSLGTLAATGRGTQPAKAEKPDLIVADLSLEGDDLLLVIQNQGPGAAKKGAKFDVVLSGTRLVKVKGNTTDMPVTVTVSAPAPEEPLGIEKVKVPLSKFGVKDKQELRSSFTVELDPKNTVAEEREKNNSYHRQLDFTGNVVQPPRGDYAGKDLPDLAITDITQDENRNIVIHFTNKGKGATGADFIFEIRSGKNKFPGNFYYRYRVPPPGSANKTGGFGPGLLNLRAGVEVEVEATIDSEDRVRETDKTNNTFKKKLTIK
jgi:hypothetical protein